MSKHAKLLNYLQNGNEVTAKQIEGTFGIKSPSRAVHYLREQGNCIYANKVTLSDGTESTKYRIGKPSKRMVAVANAVMGSAAFTRQ
jgi:predicted transcriptional regulator